MILHKNKIALAPVYGISSGGHDASREVSLQEAVAVQMRGDVAWERVEAVDVVNHG